MEINFLCRSKGLKNFPFVCRCRWEKSHLLKHVIGLIAIALQFPIPFVMIMELVSPSGKHFLSSLSIGQLSLKYLFYALKTSDDDDQF